MTADEWKRAEQMLLPPFGHAKFLIDGYNVTVETRRTSIHKYTYSLMVFVNGVFKGEWLTEDCEIRRRFYFEGKKNMFTGKEKQNFIKKYGKREYNRFVKENPDRIRMTYYTPCFGSFRTLKAHFIKNNTSITLVE